MVKYTEGTPDWIKSWVEWTVSMLIPDWDISVRMMDNFDDADKTNLWNGDGVDDLGEDRKGEIVASSENLSVDLKLLNCIEDNHDGHLTVVHELCHAFVCSMSEAAKNLISSKVVRRTAWKNYDAAEETTVVRLSRILVNLRDK